MNRITVAEEMRLLYVALTRAKQKLHIIGGANIENLSPESTDYDILSAKSFLHLLAPALLAPVRDDCFNLEIIDADEVEITPNPHAPRVLSGDYDRDFAEHLRALYNKPYPHPTATTTRLKTTVTALVRAGTGNPDHARSETDLFQSSPPHKSDNNWSLVTGHWSLRRGAAAEHGITVHKKLQHLPLADLETLFPIIRGAKVYRELPFLMSHNARASETPARATEHCGERTPSIHSVTPRFPDQIVQGVIDLLALHNHTAIIIDYKTTRGSPKHLRTLYTPQLSHYAAAVKSALPQIKTVQTFIYSTVHERLIEVGG